MTGPLTPSDLRFIDRVRRETVQPWRNSKLGWADGQVLGAPGQLARLVADGHLEAEQFTGPRGATHVRYRPTDQEGTQ